MKDLKRYSGALLAWFACWILAAATQTIGLFFFGFFAAWLWLWITNQTLPTMYWERLVEPKIMLFLGILGVTHAVPGYVVFSAFPSYLWIFLIVAFAHIGLEIFIICNREPPSMKALKPGKISVQKAKRKWQS